MDLNIEMLRLVLLLLCITELNMLRRSVQRGRPKSPSHRTTCCPRRARAWMKLWSVEMHWNVPSSTGSLVVRFISSRMVAPMD